MNPEDIKVGETYYVRVKADRIEVDGAFFQLIDENGHGNKGYRFYSCCYYAFLPTPTPPKYDPRRKFRKGDIVRLREYNGRKPYDFWHKQTIKHFRAKLDTVYEDEKEDSGHVDIYQDAPIDELMVRVHASYLELVTPVEELEPYTVREYEESFAVEKSGNIYSVFFKGSYYAKAKEAAETERDRLNAEYRKEQNNG